MSQYDADYFMAILQAYENKLKELMTEDEYTEFAIEVSKQAFKAEVENMTDFDFKDFAINNFNV